MVRNLLASLLLVTCPPAIAGEPVHQVKLNGNTFTLPEGFEIELVAGQPQVERPIVAAFDDKGRLYVCDSSGSNAKTNEQVNTKPHRIVRLESTGGGGTFDKAASFVKNVMFPEGAMWLNGSLYVAAPPHIWKLTDTKDGGVADKEEIWFDGKTLTGCANDLHGPYRGPDGYIYWCKGAFAKQEYTLPDGTKFTTRAAHIFRARPDGSHLEPVMTGGMDNPVDVVFTPGGERIFSTTFFQHPANGKRDGLVHAVHGAVYGKDHDPVYEHPWTGPRLMPPMTHMGPAAPCGLHRYESDQFGKEYENNLFCTQFNMRKVSRHVLMPAGSSFTTRDSDFVVSDSLDFHPTDVIEDADGSLLILDTGGWYKLCCPTSQLVKPDVLGAIYRVRKTGKHKVEDPWGKKIVWEKLDKDALASLIDDPRPAVRRRAMDQVKRNGLDPADVATCALHKTCVDALWLAMRSETSKAVPLLLDSCSSPEPEVRTVALYGIALIAPADDRVAREIERHLKDHLLAVRRITAEALGRMKSKRSIPAILEALGDEKNDRVLDHSLTYALIEIGDAPETSKGLANASPRVRRAVLAALENTSGHHLEAKSVIQVFDNTNEALRDTAWWIAGRHPQWADQLAEYFEGRFKRYRVLGTIQRQELISRTLPFLNSAKIRGLLGAAIRIERPPEPPGLIPGQTTYPSSSSIVLQGMARSGMKTLPVEWESGIREALSSADEDESRDAISVLRSIPPTPEQYASLVKELERGFSSTKRKLPGSIALALRAAAPFGTSVTDVADLLTALHRDRPGQMRAAAADVIARGKLTADGLIALARALKVVNPLELPKVLQAFARSTDEKAGMELVIALRDPAVRPSLRAEMVKPILDKYPQAVRAEAERLYADLAEARKDERARLERLLQELKPGDVRRGQLVFNSPRTQCIACHKVGYLGGGIGPDLTRIGGIRSDRDLLESIVFPSASFVRGYEPMRLVTADDRTFNGIIKKDALDEVVIVVAADKEERIARADIASISPSSVSLMPSGLDQQISAQDLADLVAFLKACK